MDDITGNVLHVVGVDALQPGVLPHQTVVVAELLDQAAADTVGPAVASVADPGALGPQHQGGAGGAHAGELAVLLTAGMDAGVGLDERFPQHDDGALGGVLLVDVRNGLGRLLAGLLADRVGPHAVGHQEDMAGLLPLLLVAGQLHGQVVLVVAAADPHVGEAGVLDLVEADHPTPPVQRRLSLRVCYTRHHTMQ